MKNCTILAIAIILCLLAAGCTKPAAQPQVQTIATPDVTSPVQASPTPGCSLTPGPTQQPPADQSLSFTVDRNTITQNPTITTSFNGGQGLGMIESMTVTVIRSDCVQEQQVRRSPGMGTSVTLMGTTGTDRVIVVALMTSGQQFTVIDKDYPFPPKV
jgi:hypothetical protein